MSILLLTIIVLFVILNEQLVRKKCKILKKNKKIKKIKKHLTPLKLFIILNEQRKKVV